MSKEPKDFDYFHKWLLKPESRKAIHVGNRTFDGASVRVYEDLYDDMFKSVKPWIEDLLDADYKVCAYRTHGNIAHHITVLQCITDVRSTILSPKN